MSGVGVVSSVCVCGFLVEIWLNLELGESLTVRHDILKFLTTITRANMDRLASFSATV